MRKSFGATRRAHDVPQVAIHARSSRPCVLRAVRTWDSCPDYADTWPDGHCGPSELNRFLEPCDPQGSVLKHPLRERYFYLPRGTCS